MVATVLPDTLPQYSLEMLPLAVQPAVVELTITETAAEVVTALALSVALAVKEYVPAPTPVQLYS
jgi:hypothetical protein